MEVTTDPDEHLSSRQAGSLNRPMMDLSLGTDMEKFISSCSKYNRLYFSLT